jgi:hypothetical protein
MILVIKTFILSYPDAAPAWFQAAMNQINARFDEQQNQFNARMNQVDARMNQFDARFDVQQNAITQINVRFKTAMTHQYEI